MKNKIGLIIALSVFLVSISSLGVWLAMSGSKKNRYHDALAVIDFPKGDKQEVAATYQLDNLENSIDYTEKKEMPWMHYAVPIPNEIFLEEMPKIALILTNLGRDPEALNFAIEQLPQAQTLALLPYTDDMQSLSDMIRAKGREILITLSMEPTGYPYADPGPMVLLTQLSEEENLKRLHWVMNRSPGVIGFTSLMGDRFLADKKNLMTILRRIKAEGRVFLESQINFRSLAQEFSDELKLPYLRGHFYIDEKAFMEFKDQNPFLEVEEFANKHGVSVVIVEGYMPHLKEVQKWALAAQKVGFRFIPISAVYRNPGMFHREKAEDSDEKVAEDDERETTTVRDVLQDAAFGKSFLQDKETTIERLIKVDQVLTQEISELQKKAVSFEPEIDLELYQDENTSNE